MPPQLTEAWGVVYLQILITLIVFAFGIPAFAYQVNTPENIRYIINKYNRSIIPGTIIYIVIFITLLSLSFVWFWHPCSLSIDPMQQLFGSIFFSLALIITPLVWYRALVKFLREKVVNFLEKKLCKRFKKDGSILHKEMMDLIALGERSDAGYEKEIVLKAIGHLIKNIQVSERYDGRDLELILRNFNKLIAGNDKPGNETDFIKSVEILEQSLGRLAERSFSEGGDSILIFSVLKELGKKSIELKISNQVVMRIMEIATANSSALFEIGLSAFKSEKYFAALAALNNLESLVLEAAPGVEPSDEAYNLFGLLAYFWTEKNSSRQRAEAFLNANREEFTPLYQYITGAIDYHYRCAHYDTADRLIVMRNDLIE